MGSTPIHDFAPALRGGAGFTSRSERPDTKTLIRLGTERGCANEPSRARRVLQHELTGPGRDGELVQLRFTGVREPVRARLRMHGDRVGLETSLGFLEVGSEVQLERGDAGEAPLFGRIARVALQSSAEQPIPRLWVELDLPRALRSGEQPAQPARARESLGRRLVPWVLAFALGGAGGAMATWSGLQRWLRYPLALAAQAASRVALETSGAPSHAEPADSDVASAPAASAEPDSKRADPSSSTSAELSPAASACVAWS